MITPTEDSPKFHERMRQAMTVSFHKYGPLKDAYPHKVNAIASLEKRRLNMTTPNDADRDFGSSDCSPCRYPTKQIAVPDVAACRASIIGWMDENGVTYRQLAIMCGIAAPNLNAMLRGNRNMSEAAIEAIYAVMD